MKIGNSIKSKLVLVISLLVIFISTLSAFILVGEKNQELSADIFKKVKSISELGSYEMVRDYETLFDTGDFVSFKKEMRRFFKNNEEIDNLKLVSYQGVVLYDARQEEDVQYIGPNRLLKGVILSRVQANNPSYLLKGFRIVYLKRNFKGEDVFVDHHENIFEGVTGSEQIQNFVFPVNSDYSLIFDISYVSLNETIYRMRERIVFLALFGILMGIGLGYVFSGRLTDPIKKVTEAVKVIAKGSFQKRVEVESTDEMGVLASSVNRMASDLEESTKALVDKERMAKELELAARIQEDLLPKTLPVIPGIDIAAGLIPAEEVGGDCYDFIRTDHNDDFLFYVGDVTGHGVPSGLVVSVANALISGFSTETSSPKEILVKSNKILKAKTRQNMFLTMVMVKWDSEKESIIYASAGHEKIFHFSKKQNKVLELEYGGMALGMLPDVSSIIKEREVKLEKGDYIILYTDGIPEAWKNEKEMYGMEKFKDAVFHFGNLPTAEAMKNAIFADVLHYVGDQKRKDDMTLIVLKRA